MKSLGTLLILLVILLFSSITAVSQSVSTVTGGDFTDGIGIDSNQVIYCSDYFGDKVYSYDPVDGQVSEFASGLVTPNGIGVTPDDIIYVCEATQNRITVFDTAGNQIDQITGLTNPTGIKYDAVNERLLVVSYGGNSLISLDPSTNQAQMIVNGPPFNGPSGIAFIGDETYLSNFNDRKIFRLMANNELEEIAQLPDGGTGSPPRNFLGFITAIDGFLYGTQQGEHRIYKINPDTGETSVYSGSSMGNADGNIEFATYNRPNGILADDINNKIYVSEIATGNLRVISDATLSLGKIKKLNQVRIYPVPVKDIFQIDKEIANIEFISIYDMTGKMLFTKTNDNNLNTVDVSHLSQGNYLMIIGNNSEQTSLQFIKE